MLDRKSEIDGKCEPVKGVMIIAIDLKGEHRTIVDISYSSSFNFPCFSHDGAIMLHIALQQTDR